MRRDATGRPGAAPQLWPALAAAPLRGGGWASHWLLLQPGGTLQLCRGAQMLCALRAAGPAALPPPAAPVQAVTLLPAPAGVEDDEGGAEAAVVACAAAEQAEHDASVLLAGGGGTARPARLEVAPCCWLAERVLELLVHLPGSSSTDADQAAASASAQQQEALGRAKACLLRAWHAHPGARRGAVQRVQAVQAMCLGESCTNALQPVGHAEVPFLTGVCRAWRAAASHAGVPSEEWAALCALLDAALAPPRGQQHPPGAGAGGDMEREDGGLDGGGDDSDMEMADARSPDDQQHPHQRHSAAKLAAATHPHASPVSSSKGVAPHQQQQQAAALQQRRPDAPAGGGANESPQAWR